MHRLPPLGALRAFEAAARHLSFKAAAAELGVTPTAISHQVRMLEDWLGRRLFHRRTRRVALTGDGLQLAPVLREGFEAFARTIAAIRTPAQRPTVTLTATAAFTAHWLIPRLAGFREGNPDVDLMLLASDDPVDLAAGTADLAVRYGWGPYPDLEALAFIDDVFIPVASPVMAESARAGLRQARLIHFDWRRPLPAAPTWQRWFAAVEPGEGPRQEAGDLRFSEESHAIEAAIAGHGVALLSRTLVADAMARGLLRQLSDAAIEGPQFHLVWPRGRSLASAAEAVRDWLLAQAGAATARKG